MTTPHFRCATAARVRSVRLRHPLVGAALLGCGALLISCGGGGNYEPIQGFNLLRPAQADGSATCAQLATDAHYGLSGIHQVSVLSAASVAASGPTPAYCRLDLTYSALATPADGYDVGQTQAIKMRFLLPDKSAWNGSAMYTTGPGSQGQVDTASNFMEGITLLGLDYAVRLGMVGVINDAGHTTAETNFPIIQGKSLNLGKTQDWADRGSYLATLMGKDISRIYYGKSVGKNYWNGCSGAGFQGLGQLQNHAAEYDGFLIGAPAIYWDRFFMAYAWRGLVIRDALATKGKSLTAGQVAATNTSAIATCDAVDGVTDGMLGDPRTCTFSATANVCGVAGAPAAPNCLDADQAAAIDRIWDGPRNAKGTRIWFGIERGINFATDTTVGNAAGVIRWHHFDANFVPANMYTDAASLAASANPNGFTYENEAFLGSTTIGDYINNQQADLSDAKSRGVKVIMTHGTFDASIDWKNSMDYYRRVAAGDYAQTRNWFRYFMMPGVGHCTTTLSGGVGASASDPFLVLKDWVENGKAPDAIRATGGVGAPANRSRKLCPYPQQAVYSGAGSVEDWNNYTCGGNLETPEAVSRTTLAGYKQENK